MGLTEVGKMSGVAYRDGKTLPGWELTSLMLITMGILIL
jgi:hypothetical protein